MAAPISVSPVDYRHPPISSTPIFKKDHPRADLDFEMNEHDEILAYCCVDLVRRSRWTLLALAVVLRIFGGEKWPTAAASLPASTSPPGGTRCRRSDGGGPEPSA